jgi:hypothetical protein
MRFLLAALLFILAISLLLLGLAQRTIWAPPSTFSVNLSFQAEQPYLLIPSRELTMVPGEATVTAIGSNTVYLAVGREADVSAWISLTSHLQALKLEDTNAISVREVQGTEDFASPIGSDLWVKESLNQNVASVTIPEGGKYAVLIASDGFEPVPNRVSISWPIATSTTVSDTFLAVGSALLLAAIILNLLALRKMLINRGPRRKLPKAPQGPRYRPKKINYDLPRRGRRSARQKLAVLPLSVGLVFVLSGCSVGAAPIATPTTSESPTTSVVETIPPVVNQVQVRKILRELQQVVAEADESGDATILESRVAGPAYLFREVHYLLMSRSEELEPLPPISSSAISIALPSSTNTWPRSFMIVTEADGQLPQALFLQQASPRDKYKLWYNIPLLPGSEIPAVAAPEVGAIPVEKDSLFLTLSPNQLPGAFGDVIDNGIQSEFYNLFNIEGDEFYEQISTSQKNQLETLERAEITFSHSLADENIISLLTSDSGALVALMMRDEYIIRPTERNAAVTVSGLERLLLGVEGSATGIRTQYGDMLLFYVPAANSDGKITLLGATQSLIAIGVLEQ